VCCQLPLGWLLQKGSFRPYNSTRNILLPNQRFTWQERCSCKGRAMHKPTRGLRFARTCQKGVCRRAETKQWLLRHKVAASTGAATKCLLHTFAAPSNQQHSFTCLQFNLLLACGACGTAAACGA